MKSYYLPMLAAVAAGLIFSPTVHAQLGGRHLPPPPPMSGGTGGPIFTGSDGQMPPPPPMAGGTGGPVFTGSDGQLPPPPMAGGTGGPILTGSDGQLPPPPRETGSGGPHGDLESGSFESLNIGIPFVATSGSATAAGVLQAISRSGTDSGSVALRTAGLAAGAYTVSATTASGSDTTVLGSFSVNDPANPARPRPARTHALFGGNHGVAFPDGFDPFDVATLTISGTSGNVLFTADLSTFADGAYLARAPLSPVSDSSAAGGMVRIKASSRDGSVSGALCITAAGLAASTPYTWAVNGNDLGTATSTANGRLQIMAREGTNGTLPGTVNLFDVTSVTISDSDGNVVLRAAF